MTAKKSRNCRNDRRTRSPAQLVGRHMSHPLVARADWDGLWPMVNAGGVITHIVDSGDIETLDLVPIYWDSTAERVLPDSNAAEGNDCAAAFAERNALVAA